MWNFLRRVFYHLSVAWHSIRFDWNLYKQDKNIPGLNIKISGQMLDMSTERNAVGSYPTPEKLTDERLYGHAYGDWNEK